MAVGLFEVLLLGAKKRDPHADRKNGQATGELTVLVDEKDSKETIKVKCELEHLGEFKGKEMTPQKLYIDVYPYTLDNGRHGISYKLIGALPA